MWGDIHKSTEGELEGVHKQSWGSWDAGMDGVLRQPPGLHRIDSVTVRLYGTRARA